MPGFGSVFISHSTPSVTSELRKGRSITSDRQPMNRKPHNPKPTICIIFICFLLLVPLAPCTAAEDVWKDVEHVVAVGDVHGDYEQFVAVLRSAKLIDSQESWSGGKTHLVQTGDVLDRGPDSR